MEKQSNLQKTTGQNSICFSTEEMAPRRSKRAGRPRLDANSDAILSDDRRTQVRRAQRKYRLKKEAIFRNATSRAEQLEAKLCTAVDEIVGLSEIATEAQLHLTHPDIHACLQRLRGILADDDHFTDTDSHAPAESSPASSGHQVPMSNVQIESPRQSPISPPLPARRYTYAFQEVRFARQLQRYCLEHAYRLFTERQSDPLQIYRVFRLVPCVRDPGKTQPRFRQLLTGGRTDPLEVPGLPFYCIGGAGTHFPDVDKEGNAIYPANSRIPRRVLGNLPQPEPGAKGDKDNLEFYGFGGDWFDSRDVEGYLRLHGVDVNEGLSPTLHIPSGKATGDGIRSYILDVEGFFSSESTKIRDRSYADRFRAPLWTGHPWSCTWIQKNGCQACIAGFSKESWSYTIG